MEISNYKKRIVDEKIEKYLKLFGAVVIEGPKYCGKTWTGRKHAQSEALLYATTGGSSNIVELAKISPKTILDGAKPKLIDEWQNATNLWDEIRYDVDRTGLKGQYILTGSSTPNRSGINHSGAGRFGKIKLRTMSLYESGDSTGDISLKSVCEGQEISKMTGEVDLKKLAYLAIRGGFPWNLGLSSDEAVEKTKSYVDTLIDDDIERLDGIARDKHKILLLLKSLARHESKTVSNATIKKDIKDIDALDIDIDTVASYLNVLNRLYLLDNDEPFSTNIRSSIRVKQSEKRHFADPSITCSILNLTVEKLINDLETFGFIFEAMVERDLKVYADSFYAKCFHYQDYLNNEIDSVIELADGSWCAFEIKLGANQIDNAANNLVNVSNKIKENGGIPPKVMCVICGLSNAAYKRCDGVYVIPITALKN